jgi:ATP-dependent helicase/DNAse subunit B
MLLRDPLRFAWRYALGWREPQEADEPLTLDPLAFGNLVHETLQTAVDALEGGGGLGRASAGEIVRAIDEAAGKVAAAWEGEQPVPPAVLWRHTLAQVARLSSKALTRELVPLPGQRSWTEIPFGTPDASGRNDLPWDPAREVEIPGTGIRVTGHIDRLDLSEDGGRARVIDYKTGKPKDMTETTIDGGRELQRCLYAFAVKTLLGYRTRVETSLLYVRAQDGDGLFGLENVDGALATLAGGIRTARESIENGLALPGIDVGEYNDFALALPASPSYLARKKPLAAVKLGAATAIWEAS